MSYTKTSSDPQDVIYLGVRCRIQEGRLRTTLYDREEDYPFHITRYPEWETTAPRTQLGGVLMGRYIACLEACSHMHDFKESVANVVRHAMWRNYPPSLIKSVWARFLQKRWQAADIRGRELVTWFKKLMEYLNSQGVRNHRPNPRVPQPPIHSPQDPLFWSTFGRQSLPPPPGITQDLSQSVPPPSGITQVSPQPASTIPPSTLTRQATPPRPDKGRLHPAAPEDDETMMEDLLHMQGLDVLAGTCTEGTPSQAWEGLASPKPIRVGHHKLLPAAGISCIPAQRMQFCQ